MQVSIIIPTYNRSNYIKFTLQSIIAQTFLQWEAIVVDDGSTDDTCEVVRKMAAGDNRIKLILRNRQPKGAPVCRNIGVEYASADFVMFLDSDDLLAEYCLNQRTQYISEFDDQDFWVFPMLLFQKKINDTNLYTNLPNEENDLLRFLRSDLPWSISCVVWKKLFFRQLGGFDEQFPNCQDHDLHLRALWKTKNYRTFPLSVPDNFYRQHAGEKIYNPNDKKRILVGARKLVNHHATVINAQTDCVEKEKYSYNLSVYFKYLVKQHLFIGDYKNAIELKNCLVARNILKPRWALLFRMYILLAKLGFSRIKGFYLLWDTIFYKFRSNTHWGKIPFNGELSFDRRQAQVEL